MFYPDQRHLLELTTIRRERLLPEDAIGDVEARAGMNVNLRDIVARGRVPSRYLIVEAAAFFRLKNPDDLTDLLLVQENQAVETKMPLAEKGKKVLLSPATGLLVFVGDGRLIIQESPEDIDLEAGLEGQVVGVQPGRGVVIETFGGLVQGVWGNNRRVIGVLRMEPNDGLENIFGDELNTQYRGAIVVTRRPLRQLGLQVMADQGVLGVIAPSMEPDLIEPALKASGAVLLTEGFGPYRMSAAVVNLLSAFSGRQATLDSFMPARQAAAYPEVIMSPSARSSARPPRPNPDVALQVGMTVRLTRLPNAGLVGKVVNLPKTPCLIDNGLRVPCAIIEMATGERFNVPLVNLEVFGK